MAGPRGERPPRPGYAEVFERLDNWVTEHKRVTRLLEKEADRERQRQQQEDPTDEPRPPVTG